MATPHAQAAGLALVSISDAANVLSLSPITIRRAIRSGALPSVRIGSAVRIIRDDLAAFVAARRVAAGGA